MLDTDFQLAWHDGADWPEWGSAPRRPLVQFDIAHKGEWLDSVIGLDPATETQRIYHIVKCELCISVHLYPLTPPDVLRAYYQRRFYQETKPNYLAEYSEDAGWWRAVYGTVFDALGRTTGIHSGRMLDIGAGPGIALEVGMDRGFLPHAIEPSPMAAMALRKKVMQVFEGTICDAAASSHPPANYDLLWAWEVLEHSPEPEAFLLQCAEWLHPGGALVVAVPNDFTPGQCEARARFGLPSWWVAPPDHQFYFTPKTLQLLVRRCGFRIVFTRMTYPMVEEYMLAQGLCYVGNSALGRSCHANRMAYELGMMAAGQWSALEAEYMANVAERRGREIIMIGVKDT